MKRDCGIECLRIGLMFGICLLHAVADSGHPVRWLSAPLASCVDGFAFISGYYGIRFSLSKILRLYGMGLMCTLVSFGLLCQVEGSSWSLRKYCEFFLKGCWYLHAYAFLMFLAPMVNLALEVAWKRNSAMMVFLPLFLLAFGWSAADELPGLSHLMWPEASGLGSYTPLTLLGVYCAARLYRFSGVESRIRSSWLLVGLGTTLLMAELGCSSYNSPSQLVLAACIFTAFRRLPQKVAIALERHSFWMWLGPSMFAVFLIHAHKAWFDVLARVEAYWLDLGLHPAVMYMYVTVMIFCACIMLDLPRRILGTLFSRPIEILSRRIDAAYDSAMKRLGSMENGNVD